MLRIRRHNQAEFWRVAAVAEGVVVLAVTYAVIREGRLARPMIDLTAYEGLIVFAGAVVAVGYRPGVVASGLSTDGDASLDDLGLDVVVAVGIDDLLEATDAVKRGDLDARVPVVSGDELGALAGSFNEMMEGLSERELLEGQEREVTVMFVDVCDFTARAEASSARETVAFLNEFFDVVVPCVLEHGGHGNKFLGDGVLAVFGAPQHLPDRRAVRRRTADRHRDQHRSGGGRIGRRGRAAGVLRDRRRGQYRGPRTGPYAAKSGPSCCSPKPLIAQRT